MNPFQRLARQPKVYQWMLGTGPLVERIDRALRRVSRDRFGALDLAGLPTIRATVPGRKTGLPRTCTLQVIPDGDRLLVVASNWARPDHPAWSANFLAADEVTVNQDGAQFSAAVRLLTGAARDQAWQHILAQWPNYQLAQNKVPTREFRLFELRTGSRGTGDPDRRGRA
ncbi:MAG TPA: nitroreductase family deazaflavin-dependent oxidoreductase [Pseudonocardiaceae bacterium]|nr:nitroreductase family deazaflavin-dependent oxidoreductase [Pseudonocardiaceae bacterium]